ncbi:lipase [Stenotrophobium rhamnosiphilum]|uniref:Lipase n=2 Tax=Stenotrophobium rhamnosiphilum TaxID=2029166 RepID=A0A2T5MH52_9GAMM|nr:lipase [Stenotrophobium rhamnosiphilum]
MFVLLPIVSIVALLALFVAYSTFYGRPFTPAKPNTIKVACVGDSITFGNPFFPSKSYPQQLEGLLGNAYSVRNFGAIGFTAQKAGDLPYWNHRYFKLSSEFAPDIVVIMLGTNDTKPQNWSNISRFDQDLRALIQHYQTLPSKPKVILLTPPSTFLVHDRTELPSGMNAKVVTEITERVKQIGASLNLSVVDIHNVTASHPEFFELDGVHPDGEGAHLIAKAVQDEISARHQ